MLVPYSSITYDVIGKSRNAAELRIEYVVVKELFLNSGRVISILLFIIAIAIKLINPATAIPAMLLIFGIGHTLGGITFTKTEICLIVFVLINAGFSPVFLLQ